jgi:hypothetical protein
VPKSRDEFSKTTHVRMWTMHGKVSLPKCERARPMSSVAFNQAGDFDACTSEPGIVKGPPATRLRVPSLFLVA